MISVKLFGHQGANWEKFTTFHEKSPGNYVERRAYRKDFLNGSLIVNIVRLNKNEWKVLFWSSFLDIEFVDEPDTFHTLKEAKQVAVRILNLVVFPELAQIVKQMWARNTTCGGIK